MGIAEEILELKKKSNAVILAHNYQIPEIQDMADYVGDSLDLCRKAAKTDAEYIVFCGVDFMAETASIITDKTVLIPENEAKCPMACMLSAEQVREAKRKNPGVPVVLYINTLAEAKAEADVLCTSANMVKIINSLESDKVIFGPDMNMAKYALKETGKKIITIPEKGHCIVHKSLISSEEIANTLKERPDSVLIAHPECNEDIQMMAHYIESTNGMVRLAKELPKKEFIIATEYGLLYRLAKENPGKKFYGITGAVCRNMKKITPEKLRWCLVEKKPVVEVPREIAKKALKAVEKMMQITEK